MDYELVKRVSLDPWMDYMPRAWICLVVQSLRSYLYVDNLVHRTFQYLHGLQMLTTDLVLATAFDHTD